MLFAYSPQKDDELELLEGDYVFVSASDQGQTGVCVCVCVCVCLCERRTSILITVESVHMQNTLPCITGQHCLKCT